MNCIMKLKLTLVLVIMTLLSGCGIKDEISQIEPQNTQINQKTSSSTQVEDNQNKSKSSLFSDISNFKIDNPKTYFDKRFKFSVDYPASWEVYVNDNPKTDSPDGDPQGGIYIYVDSNKNDWIYVYGQNGHIGIPIKGQEKFLTSEGISGDIMYSQSEGIITIYLVLDEGFNGATINVDEKAFDKNKQQILGILKSIKINLK